MQYSTMAAMAVLAGMHFPASTASAAHCVSGTPCYKLMPQAHPSAASGFMWACSWPDSYHYVCFSVRRAECTCDPDSNYFQDQNNLREGEALWHSYLKCTDQKGLPSPVPNNLSTSLASWLGMECDFGDGKKWTENHPTTKACYDRAMGQPRSYPTGATWCPSDL